MGRLTLKQMIINRCEEERGLAERLAQISGYSSGSAFMKILRDEKKEFAKFYGLVKVVRHLFPDDEKELMAEYSLTLDPNKTAARYMLEYLEMKRMQEHKLDLIILMKNCKNTTSQEWAKLYEIDHDYVTGKESFLSTVTAYGNFKSKCPEVEVGIEIFRSYCFLDEQMHDMLGQTIFSLEFNILKIKDEYIREMYFARLLLLQIVNKVSKNRKEDAREICEKMLSNVEDENYRAWACLHYGNSYILENYDLANMYYNKGMNLVNDHRTLVKENIERSMNFLDNHWNKKPRHLKPFSKHPSDMHEVAFYYIKNGQKTNALKTLDNVKFDELNYSQKGFHMYYRGLLDNPVKNYSRSVTYFKKAGEFFYRQMPLLELSKFGIDDCIIEALAI